MINSNDNRDKMIFYSVCMTLLVVIYHIAPHLIDLINLNGEYDICRNFFELLGPIALNYFFAVSSYKFFISKKTYKLKLFIRLRILIIPFITWNTLYILLYILQTDSFSFRALILGYTLMPFDEPLWYIFVLYLFFIVFGNNRIHLNNDNLL